MGIESVLRGRFIWAIFIVAMTTATASSGAYGVEPSSGRRSSAFSCILEPLSRMAFSARGTESSSRELAEAVASAREELKDSLDASWARIVDTPEDPSALIGQKVRGFSADSGKLEKFSGKVLSVESRDALGRPLHTAYVLDESGKIQNVPLTLPSRDTRELHVLGNDVAERAAKAPLERARAAEALTSPDEVALAEQLSTEVPRGFAASLVQATKAKTDEAKRFALRKIYDWTEGPRASISKRKVQELLAKIESDRGIQLSKEDSRQIQAALRDVETRKGIVDRYGNHFKSLEENDQQEIVELIMDQQKIGRTPQQIEADLAEADRLRSSMVRIEGNERDLERMLPRIEQEAVQALQKTRITADEARQGVRAWFDKIQQHQQGGAKLSVMEHTALVHLLRSDFLKGIEDPKFIEGVRESVQLSWFKLTGQQKGVEEILTTQLPKKVLDGASYREQQFHQAVFRTPRGAASEEVAPGRAIPTPRQAMTSLGLLAFSFSHAGGLPAGSALAGAIDGYVISSMVEWLTHRYLLHPTTAEVSRIKESFSWLGDRIWRGRRTHAVIHHGRIFNRRNYSTETNTVWNSAERISEDGKIRKIPELDAWAEKHGDLASDLHENQYGMSMNKSEVKLATASSMSVAALMSHVFGYGVEGFATSMAIAPLTAATTKYMHPYLHMPKAAAQQEAGPLMRRLMDTQYFRDISRRHFVHHDTQDSNFSLFVPGADWFFNQIREPNMDQILRMEEMGLLY